MGWRISARLALAVGALSVTAPAHASALLGTPPVCQNVGCPGYGAAAWLDLSDGVTHYVSSSPSGISETATIDGGGATNLPSAAVADTLLGTLHAAGSASADLATGTLRLFASGGGHAILSSNGLDITGSATSVAGFNDALFPVTSGIMTLSVTISGTDSTTSLTGGPYLWLEVVGSSGPLAQYGVRFEGTLLPQSCFANAPTTSCTLAFPFNVTAGEELDFSMGMLVTAGGDAANGWVDTTADYSHTIGVQESGVDFYSASGVFLTASAVPEPRVSSLLGAGFALLALGSRRRRSPL